MPASATALTLPVQPDLVLGGFLAFMRATAWLVVTPPFSNRSIPIPAKVGLAAGLAVAAAGRVAGGPLPTDTAGIVGATLLQVLIGLALGMVVNILMSAVQSAGNAVGLMGGFAVPSALDPFMEQESNVVGQVYSIVAVTLLFALDGHLVLVRGFMSSFGAVGTTSVQSLGGIGQTLVHDGATFFASALQIAAPLLAVLFLAQVVLGMLAKAAPQLNVFVLGLPFQVLLTLGIIGIGIRVLPGFIMRLVDMSVSDMAHLAHGL